MHVSALRAWTVSCGVSLMYLRGVLLVVKVGHRVRVIEKWGWKKTPEVT